MKQDKIESVSELFYKTTRLHRAAMHGRMAEEGTFLGQPQILFELAKHERISQKDLAKALHLSPATITITLTRMLKAGLVMRAENPADKRIRHVMLTDKGRCLLQKAAAAVDRMMREMLADIDDRDLDAIIRVMARVVDNLQKMSPRVSMENADAPEETADMRDAP